MSIPRTLVAVSATAALVSILTLRIPQSEPGLSLSRAVLAATALISALVVGYFAIDLSKQLGGLSRGNRALGWIPFALGIVLYVSGTGSGDPALLHWMSLWPICFGIAVLFLGAGNSPLAVPGLSFLLLLSPEVSPIDSGVLAASVAALDASMVLMLGLNELVPRWTWPVASAPFVFSLATTLLPSAAPLAVLFAVSCVSLGYPLHRRAKAGLPLESCDQDTAAFNVGRGGCIKCGRTFEAGPPRLDIDIAVMSVLLAVSLLFAVVSIPLASVTGDDVYVTTASPGGLVASPLVSPPPGFMQNLSGPSPSLQRQFSEPLVSVKQFFPQSHPESLSYTVYLEGTPSHAFLVKHWAFLGGYNRTTEVLSANASLPVTIYLTTLKSSQSEVIALSYEVPAWVMVNQSFTVRNIGISVLARPSSAVTPAAYEALKSEMFRYFVAPQAVLSYSSSWTHFAFQTISVIDAMKPYAPFGLSGGVVIGLLGLVLSSDKRDERRLELVQRLSIAERGVLAGALTLLPRARPRTGLELVEAFGRANNSPRNEEDLLRAILHLEELGLVRQAPTFTRGRVLFMWRLTVL